MFPFSLVLTIHPLLLSCVHAVSMQVLERIRRGFLAFLCCEVANLHQCILQCIGFLNQKSLAGPCCNTLPRGCERQAVD